MKNTSSKNSSTITQQFWRNTLPAVTAMLVSGVYMIIDGIFIGRFVGEQGLAAVGLAYPLMTFFTGVGLLVGIGAGALISHARGSDDSAKAAQALYTGVFLLLIAALITMLYIEFSSFFLTLQGASGSILLLALEYIEVFQYTAISAVASAALPLLIRNDDSPQLATWLMVAGAILNAFLNYLLLVELDYGMQGAAWATVISMTVVSVAAMYYFLSPAATVSLRHKAAKFNLSDAKKIVAIGSSILIMHLYAGIVIALHNALFVAYGNALSLSAYAIVGYLMSLYYMLSEGVGAGVQPLLSYYHGKKSTAINRQLTYISLYVVIGLGIGFYLLLNLWPNLFISWFNDHAEVVEKSLKGLKYHLFGMFMDGIIALASVYFMALQQSKKALLISILNIVVQLPFLYILPLYYGELGIWLALPVSNILLMCIVIPLLWQALKEKNTMAGTMHLTGKKLQ